MSTQKRPKIRFSKSPLKPRVKKASVILVSEALVKRVSRNLRNKLHVKLGDEVVVISGDDKSKVGKVIKILKAEGKLIVEGVNIIKRHRRAMGPGREGEIIETEAPIYSSKVMIWDETAKKASRVAHKVLDSGEKVRIAKTSGEQID
jgi:large subunit ribosomal protein L24